MVFGYKDRNNLFNPSGLDTGKLFKYYSRFLTTWNLYQHKIIAIIAL